MLLSPPGCDLSGLVSPAGMGGVAPRKDKRNLDALRPQSRRLSAGSYGFAAISYMMRRVMGLVMREAIPNSGARSSPLSVRTGRMTGLAMLLGIAVALGACSKCDVPDWGHSPPPPRACHDGPPQQ